mgnify:CR=1 FL=1
MAVPNLWRTKAQRYRLQGNVCPACSNTIFPPKRVCPHCQYGAASSAKPDEHQAYSFVMVFEIPQVTELNATGDD